MKRPRFNPIFFVLAQSSGYTIFIDYDKLCPPKITWKRWCFLTYHCVYLYLLLEDHQDYELSVCS